MKNRTSRIFQTIMASQYFPDSMSDDERHRRGLRGRIIDKKDSGIQRLRRRNEEPDATVPKRTAGWALLSRKTGPKRCRGVYSRTLGNCRCPQRGFSPMFRSLTIGEQK
jgi:hypothetical protein